MMMICPACDKPIGRYHKTPNGFHRDCYKHWTRGYERAANFCSNENRFWGYPGPFELYKKRGPVIIEERLAGEYGRDYIEKSSESDRIHKINSMGKAAQENAYGEIVAVEPDGTKLPVVCGHGGSMWLCRKCKDEILAKSREANKDKQIVS